MIGALIIWIRLPLVKKVGKRLVVGVTKRLKRWCGGSRVRSHSRRHRMSGDEAGSLRDLSESAYCCAGCEDDQEGSETRKRNDQEGSGMRTESQAEVEKEELDVEDGDGDRGRDDGEEEAIARQIALENWESHHSYRPLT